MDTLGWFLILMGMLVTRSVMKGRVSNIPEDMRDTFVAVTTFDVDKLKEINTRTGEGASATPVTLDTVEYGGNKNGGSIGAEMQRLAKAAGNHYVWGGESLGEGGYDCSGLVYAALKSLGIYSGTRFSASSFPKVAGKFAKPVRPDQASIDDIVVWSNHMGVVTGKDKYYSALNPKTGIKEDAIHNHKGQPSYYRVGA
jgi:cell wall-associated NlpC family hydrolase